MPVADTMAAAREERRKCARLDACLTAEFRCRRRGRCKRENDMVIAGRLGQRANQGRLAHAASAMDAHRPVGAATDRDQRRDLVGCEALRRGDFGQALSGSGRRGVAHRERNMFGHCQFELGGPARGPPAWERLITRSEEHTSELQSLMRISYAVFCLKKKRKQMIKIQCKMCKR